MVDVDALVNVQHGNGVMSASVGRSEEQCKHRGAELFVVPSPLSARSEGAPEFMLHHDVLYTV
jgi:hypothetical protein